MHKISELELHEVSSRSYTTSSIDLSAVNISNPFGTQDTEPNSNKLQDEAPAELQIGTPYKAVEKPASP